MIKWFTLIILMTLFEISYSQKNVNELVDKAIQYAVKGDYKNAIIIFDAAAKKIVHTHIIL